MPDFDKIAKPAERLKEAMQNTEKSLNACAKEMGIHPRYLRRYLSGAVEPGARTAPRIAEYLNVSELWLRGYDVPKQRCGMVEKTEIVVQERSSFSLRFRFALEEAQMTANDLSVRTGIPLSMILCYTNGTTTPKEDRLDTIAHALGVSPSWLLGYTDCIDKNKVAPENNQTQHFAFTPQRLRQAMEYLGMSQIELARRTGIHKDRICGYLTGRITPRKQIISKMVSALGISESWVMGYGEDMFAKNDDARIDEISRLRNDADFLEVVTKLADLPDEGYDIVRQMITKLYDANKTI